MSKDTRIVFMGTPEFAAVVLNGLIEDGYNIVGVVSQPDKLIGRKQILTPSPVKEVALKHNLKVIQPIKIKEDYEEIIALDPELIITSAYGQIIPEALLNYPKYHCINTHGSLLPKYRGGAPIQRSIMNGDDVTGVTIMFMSKGMDEGDILKVSTIEISEDDTNSSLFSKLAELTKKTLLEFLPEYLKGNFKAIPQDESKATYAYNIKKEEEFISFEDDVKKVYNHIRGLLDNPGAYGIINDKKLKLLKVSYAYDENVTSSMFKGLENDYLRIDCLNGYIKVYEVQAEGKKAMDAKNFYNGLGSKLKGLYFKKN